MAQPGMLTFCDVMQAAQDFAGFTGGSSGPADIRRAVQRAILEVANAHEWTFLTDQGRVQLQAAVNTGTVTYVHSTRTITLDGDTWPSWMDDDDYGAVIKIGDAVHTVQSYTDNTTVVLDPVLNPGADISTGVSFRAYPLWYRLPNDFFSFTGPFSEDLWWLGTVISNEEMLGLHRYRDFTGSLRHYCVRAIPELHGAQGLFLWPAEDEAETCDFMYRRAARQLRHDGLDGNDRAGTVSVDDDLLIVTLSSAATFNATMAGALMRFGSATNNPTGLDGLYPFDFQQTIATIDSTTQLTLSSTLGGQPSGAKYVISDIVDLDDSVHEALLACVRKQLSIQRNMKDKGDYLALYKEAIQRAKGTDCRDRQIRVAGPRRRQSRRLKYRVNVPPI